MAEITKPARMNEIWASTGTKVAPLIGKVNQGWVAEKPPYEYENWLENKRDNFLAHINQMGFPAWDSVTEYQASKSYVGYNSSVWKALQTAVNQTPAENTYWTKAFNYPDRAVLADNATNATNAVNATTTTNAPLFDNDTSIASTLFVQRALGNYQSYIGLAGSITLTASQVGTFISCYSGSPLTITLPVANTVAAGAAYTIANISNSNVTIQSQGGNLIYHGGAFISSTSIILSPGDQLTIISDNSSAWITTGTATQRLVDHGGGSFTQYLSNGLKLKFGTFNAGATSGTFTYPVAFGSAIHAVFCNDLASATQHYIRVHTQTASGFGWQGYLESTDATSDPQTVTYFALGV
jgi:hypothetical protein